VRRDILYFWEQVERCRRLAATTYDEPAARILADMADEYEAKARALDPSFAVDV
jgi:hypothetical protein